MVEPAPEDPAESLRVFVVFSGMAGAWRSIKELDGRFFAGKKIVSHVVTEHSLTCSELHTLTRRNSRLTSGMDRFCELWYMHVQAVYKWQAANVSLPPAS